MGQVLDQNLRSRWWGRSPRIATPRSCTPWPSPPPPSPKRASSSSFFCPPKPPPPSRRKVSRSKERAPSAFRLKVVRRVKKLSARNQLCGKVSRGRKGQTTAHVRIGLSQVGEDSKVNLRSFCGRLSWASGDLTCDRNLS